MVDGLTRDEHTRCCHCWRYAARGRPLSADCRTSSDPPPPHSSVGGLDRKGLAGAACSPFPSEEKDLVVSITRTEKEGGGARRGGRRGGRKGNLAATERDIVFKSETVVQLHQQMVFPLQS